MTPTAKTPSLNPLPLKERMKIPRQHMPEQLAQSRATNFTEVNLGYSADLARQEALRCLECAKPACTDRCPVGVKVKEFVQLIVAGDFLGAAAKIREDNVLPAITGRVCPQEDHCEGGCLMGKKVQSLGIGYLERFVADYEQQHLDIRNIKKAPPTGKKVAIVGSGPSGLTAAGDLVQKGHQVHVFEALHEIGGVLVYGIPEFRLPKQIIREQVDYMRAMGVEFETDVVVGRTVTIDELMDEEGYDAVFIGTGAGLAAIHGHPWRAPERRLLRERVPDAHQPDACLRIPALRRAHGRSQGQECGRDRRRQHGAGRHPLRASPRRRQSVRPLPSQRGRDARPGRRSEARKTGRHRFPGAHRAGGIPLRRERLAAGGALCAHGTWRAGCLRPSAPRADPWFGIRVASLRRSDGDRHQREPDRAKHHART